MFMCNGLLKSFDDFNFSGAERLLTRSPLFWVSIITIVMASIVTAGVATVLNFTESAYSDLLSKFNEISKKYDILLDGQDRLVKERENLTQRYNELAERYSLLDLPLKSKMVPSTSDLERWLQIDKTNEYEYDDQDFNCFHFCVVLMLHSRAQHYDMGVFAIYGHSNETGEPFSHSINAIITTEGLVYIEPQLDEVWWLEGHSEIKNGTTYSFPMSEDPIYVAEIFIFYGYR